MQTEQGGLQMAWTEKQIENGLGNDGPLWRPKQLGKTDVHSLNGFAIAFMDRFRPHFAAVAAQRAPTITTYLSFIRKNDINAFATRLGASDYMIGINKGLVERIRNAMYHDKTKTELRVRFPSLTVIDSNSVALTACYFAVAFAFYHEFAHVFRGHLGYLDTVKLHEETVLRMAAPAMSPAQIKSRYLVECDADTYGGYLMSATLWEHVLRAIDGQPAEAHAALETEVVALAAFAIGLVFRIMESESEPSPMYPLDPVRCVIVQTQMGQGLANLQKKAGPVRVDPITPVLVTGMAHATDVANLLQLAEVPVDAGAAADAFLKNDRPELDALAALLKPHMP